MKVAIQVQVQGSKPHGRTRLVSARDSLRQNQQWYRFARWLTCKQCSRMCCTLPCSPVFTVETQAPKEGECPDNLMTPSIFSRSDKLVKRRSFRPAFHVPRHIFRCSCQKREPCTVRNDRQVRSPEIALGPADSQKQKRIGLVTLLSRCQEPDRCFRRDMGDMSLRM